jgi:hypothetical protein
MIDTIKAIRMMFAEFSIRGFYHWEEAQHSTVGV